MKSVFLPIASLLMYSASAQLVIDNATFFIGEGAVVTVQGNLSTNVAIQAGGAGATLGKIQMKGSSLQTITPTGALAAIPRLEIDNASHVQLGGSFDLKVLNQLDFTTGKLQLAGRNLEVPANVAFVGAAAGKFVETNGAGELRQLVPANVANKVLPLGNGANYTPFQYTTTGSTYGAGAYVGVRSTGAVVPTPQRHPRTESFLGTSWKVTKSGITGGNLAGVGTYVQGQVTGTEADLRGMYWNGTTWSLAGGAQDGTANTVAANMSANTGELYGMNKFLLVSPKVFLQGPFNANTNLMGDNLRAGGNLIPTTTPYPAAPYSFITLNNGPVETVEAALFNNNASPENDIVDWVFVELRNIVNAGQATVAQTRSVLVQRDGDLVDVDGVSPVYFKNVDGGNYAVSVRHRNHLGISTNPAVPVSLQLNTTSLNFTNLPTGSLFGTQNSNYLRANNINILYSGNVNTNTASNYSGLGNDRLALLNTVLAGNPTTNLTNTYNRGDVNMNRNANYSGLGNDRIFLLNTVLSGTATASKTQALPN